MISKASIQAAKKAFGKSKSSKKRYMTQFETTGDYGQPSVRNITYKSTCLLYTSPSPRDS